MAPSKVQARLRSLASPKRARELTWFFKTKPGQYGHGDKFLGLTTPQVRELAREYRDLPLEEVEHLLESPWHEARTLALAILVWQYEHANGVGRQRIYKLYLRRTDRINNWDLVDISAPRIIGAHLYTRRRGILMRLARSSNLWERRIAIVATQYIIARDDFRPTFSLVQVLINDRHDLIHKAMGWMLREVGKRDERALRRFLDEYGPGLPRTTLRYSLERLPPRVRAKYMRAPRAHHERVLAS
jgi:3-methyladenine DNA glycosylase AlkD